VLGYSFKWITLQNLQLTLYGKHQKINHVLILIEFTYSPELLKCFSYYQFFSWSVSFDFQVAILILGVTSIFGHHVWAFNLPGGISAGHMFELTFYICAIASNLPMSLWNIYK
jgi:hypothetical protein